MYEQTLGVFLLVSLAVFSFSLIFFNHAPVLFEKLACWVAILAAAYFSNNFWIFTGLVGLICFLCTGKTATEKLSYYFLLLPIIPAGKLMQVVKKATGIHPMSKLIQAMWLRLLLHGVLLPAIKTRETAPKINVILLWLMVYSMALHHD